MEKGWSSNAMNSITLLVIPLTLALSVGNFFLCVHPAAVMSFDWAKKKIKPDPSPKKMFTLSKVTQYLEKRYTCKCIIIITIIIITIIAFKSTVTVHYYWACNAQSMGFLESVHGRGRRAVRARP